MEVSEFPGLLLGWEIHGFRTIEELDVNKILEEAATRWLRSNEIYAILCNHRYFKINAKPMDLPTGGTVVLFDRKMLRSFRKDGHNWKKKKDGKTVKEAHEHLKVGNEERIHVYYAHGLDNPNFVRRCYWLLDKKQEHIVLVHYREVLEDNVYKTHVAPKTTTNLDSPLTPDSNLASVFSDSTSSKILSEDIDSRPHHALYAGHGASSIQSVEVDNQNTGSLIDHELLLREVNILPWEDLVESPEHNEISSREQDERTFLDQQKQYEVRKKMSNGNHGLQHHSGYFHARENLLIHRQDQLSSMQNFNTFGSDSFKSQDSFGRWMGYVMNDSVDQLDDNHVQRSIPNDAISPAPPKMDHFGKAYPNFYITDVSPSWAFATEETKVIVIGYFHKQYQYNAGSNLYCCFGNKCVPAETIQSGVFRCNAFQDAPGFVDLFLSLDGENPVSQILRFEYRSLSIQCSNSNANLTEVDNSQWDSFQYQTRLARLLYSTTNSSSLLQGKLASNVLNEAKKFISVIPTYEKEWANLTKSIVNHEVTLFEANTCLLELTIKAKLNEWLLLKIIEGCRAPMHDRHGQGVIHLCAILGYTWAVYPFSCSGLSLNFRDNHGWTALHWAAYLGREKMVAVLLSAGANPSLITDPTAERLSGLTAADLASKSGHDGLAAYLAEKGLVAHFNSMSLSGNITGSLQDTSTELLLSENQDEDDLCLKDTLAAYRVAADAAARIQEAFRQQSLRRRTEEARLAKPEDEARVIISALKIQHAFRKYNSQKKMIAAARIQHSFRTWKIRREFLNKRRQAIKIQASYRAHLMRKLYCKILWSVGVLEKAILRWKKKRKGLRGLQNGTSEAIEIEQEEQENDGEDFFRLSRRQAKERVERSVIRVQSVFRSHRAQQEYRRMKLTYDQAKMEYDELLNPHYCHE